MPIWNIVWRYGLFWCDLVILGSFGIHISPRFDILCHDNLANLLTFSETFTKLSISYLSIVATKISEFAI
jgi:hypothetical protein